MKFYEILGIKKGITSIIGSGGKTTLINTLAKELSVNNKVIITTTTHIFPFDDYCVLKNPTIEDIRKSLEKTNAVCIGNVSENGKFSKPDISFVELKRLADYVLVEADGSKNLPLKAHADFEPVIVKESDKTILVVGIDAVNKRVEDMVHRPEIFCDICGCKLTDFVTLEMLKKVIEKEHLADIVLLNKADSEVDIENASKLSKMLIQKTVISSLKKGTICLQ